MSLGLKMRQVAGLTVLASLLMFQNCAAPPAGEDTSQSTFEDGLPFAYEATLDTLSYMSCSGMDKQPVEKRAYYSFRASAYDRLTGGLGLSSSFANLTKYYTVPERARVLSEGATNANTLLSLSVRQVGNYQAPWKEGELRVGEELESFLPSLSISNISGPLAAAPVGTRINYFPGDFSKRFMEASVRFYNFDNTATDTRNRIDSRDALLVAGYTGSTSELDTSLRGPSGADSASNVYGTGYYMRFSLPVSYVSGERRVISPSGGVEELDLASNTLKTSSWDCSTNYQFLVVRPEDKAAGKVICNATVDSYANATQKAALEAVRRVLRVEDWFVDVAHKCIMPKRTGDYCYGPLNGRTIQYGQASCLNSTTTTCPHFVSVCIRQ